MRTGVMLLLLIALTHGPAVLAQSADPVHYDDITCVDNGVSVPMASVFTTLAGSLSAARLISESPTGGTSLLNSQPTFAFEDNRLHPPAEALATVIVVPANVLWVDTGVSLKQGQQFTIEAEGQWSNSGAPSVGPDGFINYLYPGTVLPDVALASLIGRVGDSLFAVGGSFEGVSPVVGVLYLAMNDTPDTYADNQGVLQVNIGLSDCSPGAEMSGELCYPRCRVGFEGIGPVCWQQQCPQGYADDGATCRRDAHIISADNSKCPLYDKCGLTFAKGCSTCPEGYSNDGCTCRRDVHIFAKESYGRGAGFLKRADYHGIFLRYINDHRNLWMPSADPLTPQERDYLKRFFPERLINGMRVYEMAGMTGAFNHSAWATTYGPDLVIVRKGYRSLNLLKHELVHACQYDQYGIEGFAYRYADQYVDGEYDADTRTSAFEKAAYVYQGLPDGATPPIASHLGYCK